MGEVLCQLGSFGMHLLRFVFYTVGVLIDYFSSPEMSEGCNPFIYVQYLKMFN